MILDTVNTLTFTRDETAAPYVPAAYAEVVRPLESVANVRHLNFPLRRPPRANL